MLGSALHAPRDRRGLYCGDVMGFEGDGALPYFESSTEAVQAAPTMRDTIATESFKAPHPVAALHEHHRGTGRVGVNRLSDVPAHSHRFPTPEAHPALGDHCERGTGRSTPGEKVSPGKPISDSGASF